MKKLSLIVLMMCLSACGNNGSDMTTGTSGGSSMLMAETSVSGTTLAPAVESDQFLADAHQNGQAEIQQAQLALQKSANGKVKNFAQRMIDHHTAANTGISQLATLKGVSLPNDLSADQKSELNRLSALTAEEFDNGYLQTNVGSHDKDVASFMEQARDGSDSDVRQFAALGIPILKAHLAVAMDIQSALSPAAFLAYSYQGGLAEIQISQLALQKTSNSDVRSFAQRMVDDHTQSNNQITTLAQQEDATLPDSVSPGQQAAIDDLSRFSDADFDKAYMDMIVVDHAKAVRLYRKQAKDGLDPEVMAYARDNQSTLRDHLVDALQLNRKIEASFLYSAYQGGQAEVGLSLLATVRSTNQSVTSFAQQMIADHNPANAQLAQLAEQKNVPLPVEVSPEHMLALVILVALDGQQFDEAYLRYNTRLHDEAIKKYTVEAEQGTDADIRNFAQNALPVLTAHQAQIEQIRQQSGAQAQ